MDFLFSRIRKCNENKILVCLIVVVNSIYFVQYASGTTTFSVTVSCSRQSMLVSVDFEGRFFGKLVTQPNASCYMEGRGRFHLDFRLSLEEAHRQRCGILTIEDEFAVLVNVEENSSQTSLSNPDENTYFIRCPVRKPNPSRVITSEDTWEKAKSSEEQSTVEFSSDVGTTPMPDAGGIHEITAVHSNQHSKNMRLIVSTSQNLYEMQTHRVIVNNCILNTANGFQKTQPPQLTMQDICSLVRLLKTRATSVEPIIIKLEGHEKSLNDHDTVANDNSMQCALEKCDSDNQKQNAKECFELKCPSDGDWHVEDLQSELIHPKEGDMEASLSPTLPSNANTMLNEHESDKTTQASYKYTVSKLCSDNGCGMDDTDSWWSRVQIAGIVVLVVLGLCLLLFLYTLSMGTVKYFIRLFKRTVIRNETAFHNCSSGSLTNVSNCLTSPNSSPSTQLKSNRGFISDPHCTHDTLNRPAVKEYNSGQETLERPPIPPREHVSSVQSQRQTQRIPFSLDLLPEPPSISVDEIRRLNSVFNQFL